VRPRREGGAHNRTRTDDLFLTKEVLCRLSYVGPVPSDAGYWLVGREGIEPPQSKTADLQSAELTTCSTYPRNNGTGNAAAFVVPVTDDSSVGADDGTRTRNRRFTKPLLYQLSYVGARTGTYRSSPWRPRMIGPCTGKGQARRLPRAGGLAVVNADAWSLRLTQRRLTLSRRRNESPVRVSQTQKNTYGLGPRTSICAIRPISEPDLM
jgi:hypothetical protein